MFVYCTSYCNKDHDVHDGKPIDHECYVLPPAALQAERESRYQEATALIQAAKPLNRHRGKTIRRCPECGDSRHVAADCDMEG